jgi:hypothetical protein
MNEDIVAVATTGSCCLLSVVCGLRSAVCGLWSAVDDGEKKEKSFDVGMRDFEWSYESTSEDDSVDSNERQARTQRSDRQA